MGVVHFITTLSIELSTVSMLYTEFKEHEIPRLAIVVNQPEVQMLLTIQMATNVALTIINIIKNGFQALCLTNVIYSASIAQ